jgi:hypothetical protein
VVIGGNGFVFAQQRSLTARAVNPFKPSSAHHRSLRLIHRVYWIECHRFAITAVEQGDPMLGARLAGASWAARQRASGTFPPPFMPIDDPEVRARAAIGEEADRAFEDGTELGLLEAVALARGSRASG